jgi:hypothetical protein
MSRQRHKTKKKRDASFKARQQQRKVKYLRKEDADALARARWNRDCQRINATINER